MAKDTDKSAAKVAEVFFCVEESIAVDAFFSPVFVGVCTCVVFFSVYVLTMLP